MTDHDHDEWCETLGCEGTPVEGGYCEECAAISPGILDDAETVGEAVNPAGATPDRGEQDERDPSTESTDPPDSPRERGVEGGSGDAKPGCEAGETASHYAAARPALETVGTLDADGEIQALGNHDFIGWYQDRAETRPEALREGFDRRGRVYALADDYAALAGELDRVLYASINYQHRDALRWHPYTRGENGKDWMNDDKPTPGYGDLAALAPFADIDLAGEYKERPLPEDKRATVERALGEYVEEFAELADDRDAVFALDSVGGAYLFVAPASTAPLAECFEGDDRRRVFKELASRMNDWLDAAKDRVNQRVPDAEGLFEPDLLNNANRLYKAPLSLHSSINGVVHPLDLNPDPDHDANANTPEYEFVPFANADAELVEDTREWGEAFTDADHADRIGALVATLWPEYADHDDVDGWQDALTAWLTDEHEREREREIHRAAVERRREERETDLADIETTDHFEDLIDAIEAIDVRDVARDVAAEWDTDPGRDPPRFTPSWRKSSSGTSCFADRDGFTDLKEGGDGGNAVTLVARAEGIITDCGQRVTGQDFWRAVEALRALGYDIPEYDPPDDGPGSADTEPVAVLPNSPRARAAANGWDWMAADRGGVEDALTVEDARERTREAIGDAYRRADRVLVEALPTMGKSYGAVAAAADEGEPITMLTTRGNREQYQQIREWCDEHGLKAKVLPSFLRDCETANGEFGEAVAETVREWYNRGATGKEIHIHYEDETRKPIPCDGPAGARCSYKAGWQFDADEYDVLIGHYLHAHVSSATKGRTVVFDEFPGDAFETALGGSSLSGAVTRYLKTTDDELPFEDFADLLGNRDDPDRRARALAFFADHDPEPDPGQAFADDRAGHALAPLATYTILAGAGDGDAGRDLGNGWEHARLPGATDGIGAFDRENTRVHLLRPPDLRYTRGVVALDGTPRRRLWKLALGTRLNHRPVLTGDERTEYLRDTLGVNIVRTTEFVKSYNSEDHVNPASDAALLDAIAGEHGRAAALLTTRTAERVHENAGLYETDGDGDLVDGNGRVSALAHYGDLRGSNRFKTERLGAINGSNHYGDGYIQKWGAFAGEGVERVGDGKGLDLEYSGVGDDVHRHMTADETLQAVMRFGRDGGGATVYVHTNTLPEWVEDGALAGEGRVIRTRSDGERQVLAALDSDAIGEEWTTAELADHPTVEIGERQVRSHLHRLAREGYLTVTVEGNGFVWRNDGLHRVGEHGEVELAPVDLDALTDEESAELPHMTNYRWSFRTSGALSKRRGSLLADANESVFSPPPNGGERAPPDGE